MTTTAHEDQYTAAPEPVRQPYDTVAILRRNVADLELALRTQTERAESYAETLRSLASYVGAGGYNADTVDAGVFEEKIRWGIGEIMTRAEAAEAELAKLAQQKPVVMLNLSHDGSDFEMFYDLSDLKFNSMRMPLFAAPVPAPHKGATHCDGCGLTWLDDGLNPLWCPYCKDTVPAPAAPNLVFMAHNKTSNILFAARKDADQYAAAAGPTAGVAITECAVIGSQSAPQAPAVSAANPVQWLEDEGDMILVPRGLLGAACSSIDKQRPAPKVLEAMRHYTMNAPQAPAVPTDEQIHVVYRNARRYLALRETGVVKEVIITSDNRLSTVRMCGNDLDAAADRLLEGGV